MTFGLLDRILIPSAAEGNQGLCGGIWVGNGSAMDLLKNWRRKCAVCNNKHTWPLPADADKKCSIARIIWSSSPFPNDCRFTPLISGRELMKDLQKCRTARSDFHMHQTQLRRVDELLETQHHSHIVMIKPRCCPLL